MRDTFVNLGYTLRHAREIVFEDRPQKYKFGTKNYGDIPGFLNAADGDPWDIFAPGYTKSLSLDKKYKIKDIMGVLLLKNGNHKIAIRLYVPNYDPIKAVAEIKRYCARYVAEQGIPGKYISLLK